jgi:hypothetical protein
MKVDRAVRLRLLAQLPDYLRELSAIAGREVRREELGSVEEAAAARHQARQAPHLDFVRLRLPLDLGPDELASWSTFLLSLETDANDVYSVWVRRTADCGQFVVNSMGELPHLLEFVRSTSETVVVASMMPGHRLLVDLDGDRPDGFLIEVSGAQWDRAARAFAAALDRGVQQ